MKYLTTRFVLLAALMGSSPIALSQSPADKVTEIRGRLEKAKVEEAAANKKFQDEHAAYQKAVAEYETSLKTSKHLGKPALKNGNLQPAPITLTATRTK